MPGTNPNPGTPKDGRKQGRGGKPGPKTGSHNTKKPSKRSGKQPQ